jgi:hypothetical protein
VTTAVQVDGGTLTVTTGATLKELMAWLGHSSVRAALWGNPPDLHRSKRAGDGNRNRMTSLEDRSRRTLADLREHRCWSAGRECP